jgi:hypothetical protein
MSIIPMNAVPSKGFIPLTGPPSTMRGYIREVDGSEVPERPGASEFFRPMDLLCPHVLVFGERVNVVKDGVFPDRVVWAFDLDKDAPEHLSVRHTKVVKASGLTKHSDKANGWAGRHAAEKQRCILPNVLAQLLSHLLGRLD